MKQTLISFISFLATTTAIFAQQTAVGTIGGSFAVSDMGAATYTIPIEVPQGINGMQPNIALVYNSQSGNGVCGLGFSISGLSAITRVPRSIYYDGTAKGIKYDATDAYALNGQRLLLVSGTEGKDGAKYGLEGDMQTEIILHGSGTTQWWEVKSGGITMKLGYTDGGRLIIKSAIVGWYLENVTDTHNNVMNYKYASLSTNCKYLSAISFGVNEVSFGYDMRTDSIATIVNGAKSNLTYRLKNITCKTNSSTYRKYELNYTLANGFSQLNSIKKLGSNSEYLPSTTFTWGTQPSINTTNLTFTNASSKSVDDQYFIAEDITGDGRANIVAVSYEKSGTQTVYVYDVKNGQVSLLYKSDISIRSGSRGVFCRPLAFTFSDYNGDGINDVIIPSLVKTGSYYTGISFSVLGTESIRGRYSIHSTLTNQTKEPIYTIGNLYGTGTTSVIVMETEPYDKSQRNKYRLEYNSPQSSTTDINLNVSLPGQPQKIFCSDFNGDGLNDILITYKNGHSIIWNQGDGVLSPWEGISRSGMGNFDVVRMGDFNGDGFADFVCNNRNSNDIVVLTSNGNGTFTQSTANKNLNIADHRFTEKDNNKFSLEVLDFNNDGKSDVIITKSVYKKKSDIRDSWGVFQKTYTYWLQSDGSKLTLVKTASSNNSEDGLCSRFVTGDFDGDGQIELMNYGYGCYGSTDANVSPQWHIYNYGESVSANKITLINGNYERSINISYSSLSNATIYSKSASPVGAAFATTIPLHVVSFTTEDNGAAGTQSTNYKYEDLYIMPQGKGILGFRRTTANNTTLGSSSSCERGAWNSTYYIPTKITTTQKSGNFTTTSVTTLSVTTKGGKRFFAYPTNTIETDIYGNKTTTTNTYNTTNYTLINQKTTYSDGSYVSSAYSYTKAGGIYKPIRTTTSKKYATNASIFSTTDSCFYNVTTGDLTSQIENAGHSAAITHSYKYDAFGNVISERTTWNGGSLPATTYTYDTSKRFITRVEQAGMNITEYSRNIFGNVLTETDATDAANKHSTKYTYDGFGRLTSSVDCFGVKTTYTRTKLGARNRYYSLCTATDGRAPVTTYFDNCGREVMSETIGERGIKIISTNSYSKFGSVSGVTNKNGDITMSQSYSYDNLGRQSSKAGTTTPYTTYSYSNRKVVAKDNNNNRSSTTTYDALGNVKSFADNVSSISYTYASCGKPAKITSSGASYSMQYDGLGRQISLSDPDAGTTRYTYDALGRIIISTNAKGVKTTNTYDTYGNLTKSTCGTVTTTYTYGTTAATRSLLQSETNGSQTIKYTYDKYHRLSSKTYIIDGESFTYSYAYDLNNRLLYVQTPLGKEEYVYDNYDNIVEILFAGQTVWKLVSYSGKNRQTTMGNTMNLWRTTTAHGQLESQSLTQVNTGVIYSKQTYTFGAKSGNLEKRTGVNSAAETFTYDRADRLINVKGSSATTITYAPNGNITSKSNVGSYSYSSSKPHAVTSVVDSTKTPSVEAQNIRYTPFNKVQTITQADKKLTIKYGPDQQRVKTIYANGKTTQTRIYAGDFERLSQNGTTTSYLYIYSPDGLVGIYVKPSNGTAEMHYAVTDHLGSLLALYKSNFTQTYAASYDAWGKQTISKNTLNLRRGYCLHEHWNELDLIDMNGRFYDPVLGRFLSPDPYVQAPDNPQNFNRYSYCLNNPLKYTDPSGEFWHIIIGAVVGGVVNLVANWNNCDGFWQYAAAFGVGAGAGAVTAATGGLGWSACAVGGIAAAGGTVTCATNSIIAQTGKNFDGMRNVDWGQVSVSAGIGGASGFVSGAVGCYVANHGLSVNGVEVKSPIIKSAIASPIGAGAGHIAGGTFAGVIQGKSLGDAFEASFSGIGRTMAIAGGVGVASTIGSCFVSGINPLTGKTQTRPISIEYDFTPNPNGENVTLYRGTTGSETNGGPLFMTDNPEYAATYVKNGGQVVKITIPKTTLLQMQFNHHIEILNGLHGTSYGVEYKIHPSLVSEFLQRMNY